ARRHGALPEDREGEARPRRPRRGLLPHGDRQPPAGDRRVWRRNAELRAAVLRLGAGPPRCRVAPARLLRRRVLALLLEDPRRRAADAPVPDGPVRAAPAGAADA